MLRRKRPFMMSKCPFLLLHSHVSMSWQLTKEQIGAPGPLLKREGRRISKETTGPLGPSRRGTLGLCTCLTLPNSSHSLTSTLNWIGFSKSRSSDKAIFSRLFWKDCCQNPSHLAHIWFYSIELPRNQPPGPMCWGVFWTPQVCLLVSEGVFPPSLTLIRPWHTALCTCGMACIHTWMRHLALPDPWPLHWFCMWEWESRFC